MEPVEKNAESPNASPSAGETKELFTSLMAKEKELFMTEDVMRLFRVSKSTVYRWRKKRLLPCIKLSGTCYYSSSVLCNFLARKMQKSVRLQLAGMENDES